MDFYRTLVAMLVFIGASIGTFFLGAGIVGMRAYVTRRDPHSQYRCGNTLRYLDVKSDARFNTYFGAVSCLVFLGLSVKLDFTFGIVLCVLVTVFIAWLLYTQRRRFHTEAIRDFEYNDDNIHLFNSYPEE